MTKPLNPRISTALATALIFLAGYLQQESSGPARLVTGSEPVAVSSDSTPVVTQPALDRSLTQPKPPVPSLSIPLGFQVLSPGRPLPIELNHLRFARVRTIAIGKDEIHEAAGHLGQFQPGDDPVMALPKRWQKRVEQQVLNVGEPRAGAVEYYDPFTKAATKLALVIVDAPGQPAQSALVQRGELQVTMKTSQGNGLVWVTTASGEPAPFAHVEIVQGASTRYTTTTDKDGLARLPSLSKLKLPYQQNQDWGSDYFRPLLAVASKGDKLAFASQYWTTGVEPWEFDIPMQYYYGSGSLVGSVNPERGIYRPGHTVHVVGAVRKRQKHGRLAVPPGKVLVRVLDPDYTSVRSDSVELTEFGTFRLDAELPATARLGRYSIEATVGDTTLYSEFRVAKYRPNRFEVSVKELEPLVLDRLGHVELETRANYLYGAPLAKGDVMYDVSVRPARQSDDPSWTSRSLRTGTGGPVSIASENGSLENGSHRLQLDLSSAIDSFPEAQRLELLVESSVTDPAGDTLSGHSTVLLERSDHTVWMRNDAWVVDRRNGWDVEIRSTGAGVTPSARVKVELYRQEWRSTANQNGSGIRYDGHVETRLVSSHELAASRDVQRVHFKLDDGGTYVARAFSGDGKSFAEAEVWAYGEKSYGRFDNQPRLGLHSDKQSYDPGQTARLLVESPYESALALVTLEQEGVISAHTQLLQGAGSELRVKLTEEHLPNVYASVSLVPRNSGAYNVAGSPLKTGYVALQVSPEQRHLKVKLAPRSTEARPGQTVPVDVTLTDQGGKPVRGEVTLWASDEGVLQLTGYETPDVFSPIYRAQYLGVSTASSLLRFTDLGYRDGGMGGDSAPGVDGQAAFRSRFLETAFFSKGIVTNRQGRATVELPLPDNITRWRVMATAADTHDRFGSAETSIRTKKPVQVAPSLPRFLSVGDRLKAGVVVHNDRDQPGKATVSLAVQGAGLSGPSTREVDVAAHGQTTVEFDVMASAVGAAEFRAQVSLGGERDGFVLRVPVHAVTERRKVKVLDELVTGKKVLTLSLPEGADPDTSELVIESAPGEVAALGSALDALIDYPHGCTEQTTSRLIPMAQLGGLLSGHPVFANERHHELMQQAVVHLLGHQQPNGGFGLWPESEAESFLTAYALFGLELAREQGLEVPTGATSRAYDYLSMNDGAQGYGHMQESARKPFAAYVFARSKRVFPESLGHLFAESKSFTPFAKALLVAAQPENEHSEGLLAELLTATKSPELDSGEAWYPGNETLQTRAVTVLALIARNDSARAKRYADAILAARLPGGGFGSTQDNLWALTALNQYFQRAVGRERTSLRATLRGEAHGESPATASRSERLDSSPGRLYRRARFELPAGQSQLELEADSGNAPGRVIARLAYNETPDRHQPDSSGFTVTRRVYDFATGAPVTRLKVGQLVTVAIDVEVTADTAQVALVDRLPAGLEAVDLELATAPTSALQGQPYDYSWVHREAHDERVSFFGDSLSQGHHQARYLARATRRGAFVHPPPRAEAMYQADVYGVGTLDSLVVE